MDLMWEEETPKYKEKKSNKVSCTVLNIEHGHLLLKSTF